MNKDLFWATLDKAVERARRTALEEAARECDRSGDTFLAGSPEANAYAQGALDSGIICANRIRTLAASQTPPGGSDRG